MWTFETSKPSSSDARSPTGPHLLILPNSSPAGKQACDNTGDYGAILTSPSTGGERDYNRDVMFVILRSEEQAELSPG